MPDLVILVIRHGIRNPKHIPKGWPLYDKITLNEGALTKLGEE